MKVCILQNVLDPYKGGNHLPLFASLKDVEFTVVCNRSKVKDGDLPSNVKVVTVPGRIGPYYYGVADFLFAKLLLAKFPPTSDFWKQFDVIHLNQVMGPALRKLKRCSAPLLFLIHHPVTADRDVSGWWLKYALLIHFQKMMCRAADRIATVSETMKERIVSDYGVDAKNIFVVPNGVDGAVFTIASDRECQSDVIAVGSFVHPRKGFPYLLEVYKKLSASGKKISDVGRRSEDQLVALKKVNGVSIHGTVDDATLIRLMRRSRVLVSTSQFEGFGLSLIEALSCGHPAFAFDVGAVSEVLCPIDPNLVVPVLNTAEMVDRIESFLALSTAERDRRGILYRNKVSDLWSMEKAAQELTLLYERISDSN